MSMAMVLDTCMLGQTFRGGSIERSHCTPSEKRSLPVSDSRSASPFGQTVYTTMQIV